MVNPKNLTDLLKLLKDDIRTINRGNISVYSPLFVSAFLEVFKEIVNRNITISYIRAKNSTASENNAILPITITDRLIIDNYMNSSLLWNAYANVSKDMSNKINSILLSNMRDNFFDYEQAKKDLISEVPELSKNRTNMIIRNEYPNIRKIAQERTYNELDPNGEWKYKWLGPNDYRTTDICKRIQARTEEGVSLEELKSIIKEEGDPKTYTSSRPFMPHLQCRHTYILVRK